MITPTDAMNRRIRFALIGCGKISARHVEALSQLEGAGIAAVSDTSEERARELGARIGVPFYTDFQTMIREVECDAVCILTPSGTHAEIAMACLEFRKPLIIEKPMTLQLSEANALTRAAKEKDVRIFVVHQYRYQPCIERLTEALKAGRLGDIHMVTARVRWCRPRSYYRQGAWRGTWAMDGGVISNQAVHHVDLLLSLAGPVHSVRAWGLNVTSNVEAEDTAVVVFEFESGAMGVIEATTAVSPHDIESSVSVLGSRGTVEVAGRACNQMRVWAFAEPREEDEAVLKEYGRPEMARLKVGHKRFYESVLEALRVDTSFSSDVLAGRHTVEVISAIYESMETGQDVRLRFRPRFCRLGTRRGEHV